VGKGCLVDQLVGQYLADICGLGPLLNPAHIRAALNSIHKYNYKRSLFDHDSVQRTFALNDESAIVICDYASAPRPHIPFPYFAEVMTGFEYTAATHMLFEGMIKEGTECIASIRARYDGERRNPWDEAECGHHYARAMAAWSGILAISGFRYHGGTQALVVAPKLVPSEFRCIWSTGTGWGVFQVNHSELLIKVHSGRLPVRSCTYNGRKLDMDKSEMLIPGKDLRFKL
jgi:familyl 116 glycosyl hydrolase-like protein